MAGLRGTVYEAFCETVWAYATRDFLCIVPDTAARYGIEARTWSYAQAALEVERLRASYADAGLGYGHRVGLMLENRPAFFFHWLALNALGASVVPSGLPPVSAGASDGGAVSGATSAGGVGVSVATSIGGGLSGGAASPPASAGG